MTGDRAATGKERLIDAAYGAGWRGVRALPAPAARWLFDRSADYAARRDGPAVRQLRRNLARVVPDAAPEELETLVRKGMRSYARYWRETFRLPSMDLVALRTEVDATITGVEHLDAALAAGNGAILALPHTGNWEVPGIWLVGHSGKFTTVAERLKPESLFNRFVAYREGLGFEIIALTGSRENPARTLSARLRENKVVCLLADRDLTAGGVPVTFFGEPSRMPAGPAHLALSTGAALIPVGNWYDGDSWRFVAHPPIPVPDRAAIPAATQALADVFAADIAAHPQDWHMLQQVWLADLPERRRRALARIDARPDGQADG